MKHRTYYCLFLLYLARQLTALGQDPRFSQFQAAPLLQNPAYAGYVQGMRANVAYRNQWRDLGKYSTSYASADVPYECGKINMAGGMFLLRDQQDKMIETLTAGLVLVPPTLDLPFFSARIGVYVAGGQRSYRTNDNLFMDQLTPGGPVGSSTDRLAVNGLSRKYVDVGLGGILDLNYSETTKDWISFSLYHLNEPVVSTDVVRYRLPHRFTLQYGAQLQGKAFDLTPVTTFSMQSGIVQLDMGTYLHRYPFMAGLFYRGLPLSRSLAKQVTQDALVMLAGIQHETLSLGFSYDFTISKLKGYSGNSFEITLRYSNAGWLFGCAGDRQSERNKSLRRQIRCPY